MVAIGSPWRRLIQDPRKIVGPYVRPKMTVLDVGCGLGFFSIPMAAMVGDEGGVIAVDLQTRMLDMLRRCAERAGVMGRIHPHRCEPERLGVQTQADFALAFAVVHEVPDARQLFDEIRDCLKADGRLLFAEPWLHVPDKAFRRSVAVAKESGFRVVEEPSIRGSRAVLLGIGQN